MSTYQLSLNAKTCRCNVHVFKSISGERESVDR